MMIVWHATWSVTVGRIYAPSTAMWPNNNSKLQIIKQVHQWFMSPHGIVPFTRWQHRINVLYGKASSIHQRAPPVNYFKIHRECKTGPKFTKIAWDLIRTNARHRDKFHRAPKSNVVPEKLQNKTHRAKRDRQTNKNQQTTCLQTPCGNNNCLRLKNEENQDRCCYTANCFEE